MVQGWHTLSFWQAIRACWRSNTPVLVRGDSQLQQESSGIKRIIKFPLYRWFIPKFDAYLVVGERAKQYYLHYGAEEEKMFFSPHSVDNIFFSTQNDLLRANQAWLRAQYGIAADAVVFLFAGKLIPKKRPFDFIKALQSLHPHDRAVEGVIVGDGPLRGELQEYCRRHNVPVHFLGFLNQTDMPKAYGISDVLVLPSDDRETWGLVVNEAMASGLACLVSDRAGCVPDLIVGGKTGDVFPCAQVPSLTERMRYYAAHREEVKNFGRQAQLFINHYSPAAAAEGIVEAIRAVTISGARASIAEPENLFS
jgi:glycosyltransferase involved in cell wall biosynthesis